MTTMQFDILIRASEHYAEKEAFVADMVKLPVEQQDAADTWEALHRSVRDIVAAVGCSQRKLAERFFVPYRTMEDWCRGISTPPLYVRLMMQQLLGLLPPMKE